MLQSGHLLLFLSELWSLLLCGETVVIETARKGYYRKVVVSFLEKEAVEIGSSEAPGMASRFCL